MISLWGFIGVSVKVMLASELKSCSFLSSFLAL